MTSWTVACQTPLSMGFSRQECWSGLSCPPPRDLPNTGIEPMSLMSPALAGRFFTTSSTKMYIVARPQHRPDVNLPPITQETPSFSPLAPSGGQKRLRLGGSAQREGPTSGALLSARCCWCRVVVESGVAWSGCASTCVSVHLSVDIWAFTLCLCPPGLL